LRSLNNTTAFAVIFSRSMPWHAAGCPIQGEVENAFAPPCPIRSFAAIRNPFLFCRDVNPQRIGRMKTKTLVLFGKLLWFSYIVFSDFSVASCSKTAMMMMKPLMTSCG
jgi:hypothetical protein